jgi:hypothetical protein
MGATIDCSLDKIKEGDPSIASRACGLDNLKGTAKLIHLDVEIFRQLRQLGLVHPSQTSRIKWDPAGKIRRHLVGTSLRWPIA